MRESAKAMNDMADRAHRPNLDTALSRRPVGEGDIAFLFRAFAAARADEVAPHGWSDAQKDGYLRTQFEAQQRYYQSTYADADFELVLYEGAPAGLVFVDRRPDELRVIDLALVPEFRNLGIGGALVEALLAEAAASGKVVRIHVDKTNRARRLYERLGFTCIENGDSYDFMEARPQVQSATIPRA